MMSSDIYSIVRCPVYEDQKREYIQSSPPPDTVVMKSDVVFLCVKPHLLNNVIASLDPLPPDHNPLFVSIVTGHDIDALEEVI